MPVFNGANFIGEAIESLLNQTHTEFELIISDNGSTDNTEPICKAYANKDSRVLYVRHASNRGGLENFRYVLKESTCDYFMWAAADDVWDPRWVETLLSECIDTQSVVFGKVRQIDAEGTVITSITNDRNLSFCSYRIKRRTSFFLEPGILGKANSIYGIYPKKILNMENFSILGERYIHTDMLFIYNLLKLVNLRTNCNVILYKRIHNQYDETYKVIAKQNIYYLYLNKFKNFLKYYDGYYRLSNLYEKIVIIFLFPVALLWDIFVRLYKKIHY